MVDVTLLEFGSLDHEYPVMEVYFDGELAYEIVTHEGGSSVEILASYDGNAMLSGATFEAAIRLILPHWRDAMKQRDIARGFEP